MLKAGWRTTWGLGQPGEEVTTEEAGEEALEVQGHPEEDDIPWEERPVGAKGGTMIALRSHLRAC
eukprot:1305304-Lingulodinium_polyedra.AAC.1